MNKSDIRFAYKQNVKITELFQNNIPKLGIVIENE